MNKPVYLILCLLLIVQSSLPVYGQLENDTRSYYVVIGAFAVKRNAKNFTAKAAKTYPAKFEMNRSRNLDYVYVMKSDNKPDAVAEALRLRANSPYFDTWVYHGVLGSNMDSNIQGQDINPATEASLNEVTPLDNPVTSDEPSPLVSERETIETKVPDDPRAKSFIFKLTRTDTKATIEGDVDVIDTERARKIATYNANERVNVIAPTNIDGGISLICEVFGYRKVQRDINYSNPEGYGIVNENGVTVVPFELMRLQKGDIATMFHVYFFKDAAVMRPESRYEVNSLIEMLNENPKYKIRIHGHTNGNASGKITTLGKNPDNYFSLTGTKDGFGSAKKLSQQRGETMRDYLIASGIDGNRLQVKAWGGKKPIVDKMHAQAQSNVRVEIEILDQ